MCWPPGARGAGATTQLLVLGLSNKQIRYRQVRSAFARQAALLSRVVGPFDKPEKQSMYPVRVDYFNKAGAPAKRLGVRKLAKSGTYWRPQV